MCLPIFRDPCLSHMMKAVGMAAAGGAGQESVSVRMLVLHHEWWNSRKSVHYLPFQKVMVKHLKRNLSGKYFVCWWKWFAFLTLLPYQSQFSRCAIKTRRCGSFSWISRLALVQMSCQYIGETSKDSTLVSWWVQRGKTKIVDRGLCFWRWFFVLDSLHGALWWLINPLGSDFPLWAPKTYKVSKIFSWVKFPKSTCGTYNKIRQVINWIFKINIFC